MNLLPRPMRLGFHAFSRSDTHSTMPTSTHLLASFILILRPPPSFIQHPPNTRPGDPSGPTPEPHPSAQSSPARFTLAASSARTRPAINAARPQPSTLRDVTHKVETADPITPPTVVTIHRKTGVRVYMQRKHRTKAKRTRLHQQCISQRVQPRRRQTFQEKALEENQR